MFFSPIVPINIYLGLNSDGRKSGEADVDFDTHDEACEAMKKDKSNMGKREIVEGLTQLLVSYSHCFCYNCCRPSIH